MPDGSLNHRQKILIIINYTVKTFIQVKLPKHQIFIFNDVTFTNVKPSEEGKVI